MTDAQPNSAPYHVTIGVDPGTAPHCVVAVSEGQRIVGVMFSQIVVPHEQSLLGQPFDTTAHLIGGSYAQMSGDILAMFVGRRLDPDQLTMSFAIEDVAMQHRMGQNPASSLKLTHAFCVLSAAAALFRLTAARQEDAGDIAIDYPRPQAWRAFYALSLSEKPTKQASVDMAKRVVRDLRDYAVDPHAFSAMATDTAGLDDHNRADAFLIAMRDFFIRFHGWSFYQPLAQRAN